MLESVKNFKAIEITYMNKMVFGVVFSFFWASAFVAGKYSLDYLSPLSFLSLRFLLAGGLLIGLYGLYGLYVRYQRKEKYQLASDGNHKSIIKLTNTELENTKLTNTELTNTKYKSVTYNKLMWRDAIVLGLLNYTLYLGLSYSGLQYLSPELVVLLVSTTPFLTAFAQSYLNKRWSKYLWLALVLGFSGVVVVLVARIGGVTSLLIQVQNPSAADGFVIGVMWVLLSVLALASGTLYYQLIAYRHNTLALTGLQNLSAGVMLLPFVSLAAWGQALLAPIFLYSLVYQVVLVSGVAMLMWFQLIRWFGSGYASAFHLLNPIFATLLSVWLFDLNLSISDIIGTVMVIVAMGIISLELAQR